MLGYSEEKNIVFNLLPGQISTTVCAAAKVDTKLVQMNQLTPLQWRELKQLQGQFGGTYLRFRYGSPYTYILLAYVEKTLAHIEWIVPAGKIRARYPFVTEGSYSIISCLTARNFQGLRIYSSQLQHITKMGISNNEYWIWADEENLASLKGIKRAGAVEVGSFLQRKWLWGLISKIDYQSRAK